MRFGSSRENRRMRVLTAVETCFGARDLRVTGDGGSDPLLPSPACARADSVDSAVLADPAGSSVASPERLSKFSWMMMNFVNLGCVWFAFGSPQHVLLLAAEGIPTAQIHATS